MNSYLAGGRTGRTLAILISLFTALALFAVAANDASAKKKAKPAKVTVKVVTKNHQQLLNQKKLTVRVKSTGKTKVRLTAKGFKAKRVNFRKRGVKKKVKLNWNAQGRKQMTQCANGNRQVRVVGTYKAGKKNKKARAGKKLKNARPCFQVDLGPDPQKCDFLDQTVCLQPFPNNYYTKKDASTDTGLRVNIAPDSTPLNEGAPPAKQKHLDPVDINRADGFSPGSQISLKIPGLDTPAAVANSKLVGLELLSEYTDPDQPVLLIDAETGERQMIWAEIDSNPTSVDPSDQGPGGINVNPSNTEPVNLLVRPGKNLELGKRYIIAFRNLKDADNNAIESPLGFRVYRDNLFTKQNVVENRRPAMNSIIKTLVNKADVKRKDLYMAWDFTVISQDSLTGRATTIRDDAFARLGDTDLANRKIEGASPEIQIAAYCDRSNTSATQPVGELGGEACGNNYPGINTYKPNQMTSSPVPSAGEEQRTVVGWVKNVPCYLNLAGCEINPANPAKFEFDANGELTWDVNNTMDVPFRCRIPVATVAGDHVTPGATGTYGHGLLGTLNQINATRLVSNENNSTWCAVNWEGFSENDFGIILAALTDMSHFNAISDRMQQGLVNFLMVQRALIHPDGMAQEDAFKMTHNGSTPVDNPGTSAIDTSQGEDTRGYYYGISQGAIMGGALTALNPDVDRGALGVAGMNYSTLLRRSVDSDEYFKDPAFGLYKNYPDFKVRPLLLSLIQMMWDRGEANGYAQNMTDNPLPNTNPHNIYMDVALGDHQVTNFSADVEARTAGILRYSPTLTEGRHNWDLDYAELPAVESTNLPATAGGNFMVYFDTGPLGWSGTRGDGVALPPLENVAPQPDWGYGKDPHGMVRYAEDNWKNIAQFLEQGTISACGGIGGLCYANGWDGVSDLP